MLRPRAYQAVAGVGVRSEHVLRDGVGSGSVQRELNPQRCSVSGVNNVDTLRLEVFLKTSSQFDDRS